MDFLLDFNNFNVSEHYYDSLANQQLGYPVSNLNAEKQVIDLIKKSIKEHQIKDIQKQNDRIDFIIRNRKYGISKSGFLTIYKTKSNYQEIKNLDVLKWIFGNEQEALDALKTIPKYGGRLRTIDAGDVISLRTLNNKIGKRSEEDYNKTFKTPKKYTSEELKVDVSIDKETALNIYNDISTL